MIPRAAPMIHCAEILEMTGQLMGWDNMPPVLGLIFSDGDLFRSAPFPDQPYKLAEDPIEGLIMFADLMFRSTEHVRRRVREEHGDDWGAPTAAVFFVFEGWSSPVTKDGEPTTSDREETRACVVIDCAGRIHVVNRVRGEEPTSRTIDAHAQPDERAYGPVVDALRRIMLSLGHTMPDGSIDMEAVGALSGSDPFKL